jgi:hypothetical protein
MSASFAGLIRAKLEPLEKRIAALEARLAEADRTECDRHITLLKETMVKTFPELTAPKKRGRPKKVKAE